MTRAHFPTGKQRKFIEQIQNILGLGTMQLSELCNVHRRTVNDWKNEKTTMPYQSVLLLARKADIDIPELSIKKDFWHTKKAGTMGALAYQKKYGNPGTAEGRSKGGRNSIYVHKKRNTGFIMRKTIIYPKPSVQLAELYGIILGDGGISKYQIIITLDRKKDFEYAQWVASLIENLFGVKPFIGYRDNVVNVTLSSTNAVEFFLKNGLAIGSKVCNQIDIPTWIKTKKLYYTACVRGLIDTDGCVFVDKHKGKTKVYRHLGIGFTNMSKPLLQSVFVILSKLDIDAGCYGKNVLVRKKLAVKKYINIIGTNNPKHKQKADDFYREFGEVA